MKRNTKKLELRATSIRYLTAAELRAANVAGGRGTTGGGGCSSWITY